jgi:4-amino-4-deoxy-L-arabinose transferase-like glycosyltransferase
VLTQLLKTKLFSRLVIGVFIALQIWIISSQQLFGDEAFYWLESQYLDFSYAELPGWTAWMIRLGTDLFGHSYFSVRIISFLAYLSIYYAAYLIGSHFSQTEMANNHILILVSMPLFMLISCMALPDIWLVVFVVWISYFLIKALSDDQLRYWIFLGLIIACSINVHVRMWIWLFFASLAFLYFFRGQKDRVKSAMLISLPISLIGLLPIVYFNYQHDFVLFSFQFNQRHPWEFQLGNFSFLISQLIVVTPLVLFLWFSTISKIKHYTKQQPIMAWLLLTALMHWLFYVIMSLFADGLRTTVHWGLVSYVPVLIISGMLVVKRQLLNWGVILGGLVSLLLLLFIGLNNNQNSNLQTRLLDNSQGWHALSQAVKRIQKQHNLNNIITDYFMTAAELAYELDRAYSIQVLPHAKNVKHGREKQLRIMGMLLTEPESYAQQAMLVVEDSTLKLQEKAKYYSQLCDYFKQVSYIESVNFGHINKQFHLFKVNNKKSKVCEIPPLFYIHYEKSNNNRVITGWVVMHQVGVKSLMVETGEESVLIDQDRLENKGIKQMFPEIDDPNQPTNGFEIQMRFKDIKNNQFRIKAIGNDNKEYLSQIIYID